MTFLYRYGFAFLWIAYIVYWWVKSRGVKISEQIEPTSSRMVRALTLWITIILLAIQSIPLGILDRHITSSSLACFWIGFVLTTAGLLFSVWARHHLGSNWSQAVTVKQDHQLITSGPYAIVRHPIYTGLLSGLIGSAIALDKLRGVVAVILAFVVLWNKLRLEEKWMRVHFGEAYESYSKQVAMILPYLL
jgi:protein-S-isoprenylcysteine O-methyltransferase Ste14